MWLNDCEAESSGLFFGDVAKCDQPAIGTVGIRKTGESWKLCLKHFNISAKNKIRIRKDGTLLPPRSTK